MPQLGDPDLDTWWDQGEGGGREASIGWAGLKVRFQTKLGQLYSSSFYIDISNNILFVKDIGI